MQSHEEMFEAILAGETIESEGGKHSYKLDKKTGRLIYNSLESYRICHSGILTDIEQWSIKQRTININGHEFPEPLRVAPKEGTPVFIPAFEVDLFSEYTYFHDGVGCEFLEHGVLHLTKEAAIAHAKALLSFTEKEEKV